MPFSNKTHRTVTPREAAADHSRGELVIVDVRESGEREVDHVAGSLHVPLTQLPRRMSELSRFSTVELPVTTDTPGATPDPNEAA